MNTIELKINSKLKKEFKTFCKTFGMAPMPVILILMQNLIEGNIALNPIQKEYQNYKLEADKAKTKRILKYRISGNEAHRLNKVRKEARATNHQLSLKFSNS